MIMSPLATALAAIRTPYHGWQRSPKEVRGCQTRGVIGEIAPDQDIAQASRSRGRGPAERPVERRPGKPSQWRRPQTRFQV